MDCKSIGYAFEGSNPSPATFRFRGSARCSGYLTAVVKCLVLVAPVESVMVTVVISRATWSR
jgi:hypothetical protein